VRDPEIGPCFSARLVHPFVRVLRRYPSFPSEQLDQLEALDPDDRIPITRCNAMTDAAVAITGDPDLGLKAAREIAPGEYGVLEYAATSAPTGRDALLAVGRYLPLINDALDFSVRSDGDKTLVQLDSRVALPRAAIDFQSAACHMVGQQRVPPGAWRDNEVWFAHARPASTDEYERTFGEQHLRFSAPWNGFVLSREYMEAPQLKADPKLHALLRKHGELLLAELPRAATFTEQVRDLIATELGSGTASVEQVARVLQMSPRTLGRKLQHEGTSFKHLLDDLRRRMALRYVDGQELGLSEIAFLLGFSQTAAFHRAFKRWTAQTPLEYRRQRRAGK
jgi:AraC-like DNA-binding protein